MTNAPRRFFAALCALPALCGTAVQAAAPQVADICGECRAEKVASCGGFLEGPSVDAQGSLWVTDVVGDRVLRVEPSGECTLMLKTGGHPNGARFRSDGKLMIADWKGLLLFDPATGALETVPLHHEGKALTGLNDLAYDAAGGIYFTVPGSSSLAKPDGRLYYRSPAGEVKQVGEGYAYPNGVAVSADDEQVYLAEFAAKRIVSIPSVTAKTKLQMPHVFAWTMAGVGVDGMIVDHRGYVFAANLGAREVLVYDRSARLAGAIPLPDAAGAMVTNVAMGKDYLYVTEAEKGEVWRIRLKR